MVGRRGRRGGHEPSLQGISFIAECVHSPAEHIHSKADQNVKRNIVVGNHSDDSNSSRGRNNMKYYEDRCLLLLGNLDNALAATVNSGRHYALLLQNDNDKNTSSRVVQNINISHIVSVADNNKARQVYKAIEQNHQKEDTGSHDKIQFLCFPMQDRLRMDQEIDIEKVTKQPIEAIEQGIGFPRHQTTIIRPPKVKFQSVVSSSSALSSTIQQDDEEENEEKKIETQSDPTNQTYRAILVHCNEGYNRSPTLILMYLLQTINISLRQAYKILFQGRRVVDPLPPYRKGLRDYELQQHKLQKELQQYDNTDATKQQKEDQQLSSSSSVQSDEIFHLHLSQLLQLVRTGNLSSKRKEDTKTTEQDDAHTGSDLSNNIDDDGCTDIQKVMTMRQQSIENLLSES